MPAEVGSVEALDVVLQATRALLWIATPSEASAVARDLVRDLGGGIVAARAATSDAMAVDVSFGEGEPALPVAPPVSVARVLLERHVPIFVRDVHRALELADRANRLAEDASIDALTGLPNRRMLGRALGRLRTGDTVIMIDLDHFKAVNDTLGHPEGDRVLRLFGRTLAGNVRATDRVGRYGGEEFMVLLHGSQPDQFLSRLRAEWLQARPQPITFSAGVAVAGAEPGQTVEAADRALYRAKQSGRDQWTSATEEDYR